MSLNPISSQRLTVFIYLFIASDFAPDPALSTQTPGKLESCLNGAPNTLWFPWNFPETQSAGDPLVSLWRLGCRKLSYRPTQDRPRPPCAVGPKSFPTVCFVCNRVFPALLLVLYIATSSRFTNCGAPTDKANSYVPSMTRGSLTLRPRSGMLVDAVLALLRPPPGVTQREKELPVRAPASPHNHHCSDTVVRAWLHAVLRPPRERLDPRLEMTRIWHNRIAAGSLLSAQPRVASMPTLPRDPQNEPVPCSSHFMLLTLVRRRLRPRRSTKQRGRGGRAAVS